MVMLVSEMMQYYSYSDDVVRPTQPKVAARRLRIRSSPLTYMRFYWHEVRMATTQTLVCSVAAVVAHAVDLLRV